MPEVEKSDLGVDYPDDHKPPVLSDAPDYRFPDCDKLTAEEIDAMQLSDADIEAKMERIFQAIDHENGRKLAQSQWSALKKLLVAGDINQEDAHDNFAAIKRLAKF